MRRGPLFFVRRGLTVDGATTALTTGTTFATMPPYKNCKPDTHLQYRSSVAAKPRPEAGLALAPQQIGMGQPEGRTHSGVADGLYQWGERNHADKNRHPELHWTLSGTVDAATMCTMGLVFFDIEALDVQHLDHLSKSCTQGFNNTPIHVADCLPLCQPVCPTQWHLRSHAGHSPQRHTCL